MTSPILSGISNLLCEYINLFYLQSLAEKLVSIELSISMVCLVVRPFYSDVEIVITFILIGEGV